MANLSQRAGNVSQSGTLEVENQVRLLEAQKHPVIKLHIGNTCEKTDDLIIAKAHEALLACCTSVLQKAAAIQDYPQ